MDLLAHLEAYVAVAQERSFSRAADVLYVAQPVLSRRIKTLEQHLGGELFDRSGRQVSSTDLGALLLPHAKDVLSRVEHLRQVARTAAAAAPLTLGVPPDSDPAALARVIRAATEHGVAIRVYELAADERESGLADGSLSFALVRVPPESASLHVPLGLASAVAGPGLSGSRPVHLDGLRPPRGGRSLTLPMLVTAEDQTGFAAERLAKAAARAGLPDGRIQCAAATATAVAETLAGHAMLACAEPFARRHGLTWAPLADATLHRGYDLATGRTGDRAAPVHDWLAAMLADAIGAAERAATAGRDATGSDPHSRLAARG